MKKQKFVRDLIGKRFSRLKVLHYVGKNNDNRDLWKCKCDCGKIIIANAKTLLNGDTRSCGCLKLDLLLQRSTKHGDAGKPFYKVWKGIRQRCNNPNDNRYKHYGGRGIIYDPKWEDYVNFKRDMLIKYRKAKAKYGMGVSISIERIDVNGNYCFDNCCFIPLRYQAKNQRKMRWFAAADPLTGNMFIAKNQIKFANEHDLSPNCISNCLAGKRKNIKAGNFH